MKSEVTITLTHEMKQLVADYMQEHDIADETQAVTMALHDALCLMISCSIVHSLVAMMSL